MVVTKSKAEQKAQLLIKYVETHKIIPKVTTEYQGIKLGTYWASIKKGCNKNIYDKILSKNPIIKKNYEKFSVKKKTKILLSPEERGHLLVKFVEEHNQMPTQSDEYEDARLGQFWNTIKKGYNKNIYDTILSKNEFIKNDYKRYLKVKDSKKDKIKVTSEQKAHLIVKYVVEHNKLPPRHKEYEGVKFGQFWSNVKQGQHKRLYQTILSKNEFLRTNYNTYLESKENKKETLTPEQKSYLLIKFIDEYTRIPKQKEEYGGVKIGSFWYNMREGDNKQFYDKLLSRVEILKNDYDKYLESKKTRKNRAVVMDEKIRLLFKFVNEFKKMPKTNEEYEGVKIGTFWKQSYKKYESVLSTNKIVQNAYNMSLEKKQK